MLVSINLKIKIVKVFDTTTNFECVNISFLTIQYYTIQKLENNKFDFVVGSKLINARYIFYCDFILKLRLKNVVLNKDILLSPNSQCHLFPIFKIIFLFSLTKKTVSIFKL
jgi:hypothetical protein